MIGIQNLVRLLPFVAVTAWAAAEITVAQSVCGKRYCKDMRNCAEAHYHMVSCYQHQLDRDRDGIPCETLCGKSVSTMKRRIAKQPFRVDGVANTGFGILDQEDTKQGPEFSCAGKRTCGQMDSCEEATFYLKTCGLHRLDGNRDGIACNSLCRR